MLQSAAEGNRTASASPASDIGVSVSQRWTLLRQHGDFSSAYSTAFQPGLEHFHDGHGYIAYRMVGGTALALADPVAPREQWPALLDRFIAAKRDVCFCQASHAMALLLAARGFFVNEMGIETSLDLSTFSFEGRSKRALRNGANRMARLDCTVREVPAGSLDPAVLLAMSESWRGTRIVKRREVTFLNRPAVLDDETDVRQFFVFDPQNRPVALGFFDPVYQDGAITGYVYGIKRRTPEADRLASYAILHRAITTFQAEGRRWLHLGLSPMAGITSHEFARHGQIAALFRFMYENALVNRYLYNLQGLALNKGEFGGVETMTYFACNTSPGLWRVAKLGRACGLL